VYRARKAVAALCIVALIVTACLPGLPGPVACAVLVALWMVLPPIVSAGRADERVRAAEQPIALLALLPSRAPPALLLLV
jgi:hypothetical protein